MAVGDLGCNERDKDGDTDEVDDNVPIRTLKKPTGYLNP